MAIPSARDDQNQREYDLVLEVDRVTVQSGIENFSEIPESDDGKDCDPASEWPGITNPAEDTIKPGPAPLTKSFLISYNWNGDIGYHTAVTVKRGPCCLVSTLPCQSLLSTSTFRSKLL